ncbi:MAG: hypothetical protein U0L88_06905 [Acutalibacteraceae bacterium]|nr:hypothetical protein [Acutalibacteraceae bacterium]
MALYKSGLELSPVRYSTASEFDITFDCKPQRFLVDGDRAIYPTEWSDVQTATGELVTIESDGSLAVKSLEVSLSPIQEGSGEPSPTNIRPISGRTSVDTIVSPTTSASDGRTYTTALGRTVYGGTLDVVSGVLTVDRASITIDGDVFSLFYNGQYSTGNTEVRFTPTPTKANGATNLIADRFRIVNYTSAQAEAGMARGNPTRDFIYFCVPPTVTSKAEAIAYFQANPTQVCYELATPQTYQLTPQQVTLLLGENHLWSDGEITVTYGVHPYYNPTPFASKPLIKVTGRGTLGIGEYILTITGTASQTLYIDCETMEIYALEGTVPTGASSLVSINKNDFPVLEPGTNNISVGSGITAVTITPRWWRI